MGNVAGSASHIERTRPTHNANPDIKNEWLVGDGSMYEKSKKVWDKIPKIRKDAVHAFEVLLTASPEAFENINLDEWKKKNIEWLKKEFAGCEIVGACLHLDESTPHIQAIIIPTDIKKDGSQQLNCKKYLGGPAKLKAMQTSYAKSMAGFGLERGVEGSKAKHTTIAQFYKNISAGAVKIKPFDVQPPPSILLTKKAREEWAKAQTVAIKSELAKPINNLRANSTKSIDLNKQNNELKRSNSALTKNLKNAKNKIKEQADKMRQLPLTEVAEMLGCYKPKSAKDKNMWITPAGRVFIKNDLQFINHDEQAKGGGAIDFVMHIKDCGFTDALTFLERMYGSDAAIEAAATAARLRAEQALKNAIVKPFAMPVAHNSAWSKVRAYLTVVRGLAETLIDNLKSDGWLYADRRNNVVFVNTNAHTKEVCAYELKGTTSTPFTQAQGDSKNGIFIVEGGKSKLAICESAIDAISYVQLHPHATAVAVAGTAKFEAVLPYIEKYGKNYSAIVCASDNDAAGANMAANLDLPHHPPAAPGADWNDVVKGADVCVKHDAKVERERLQELERNTKKPKSAKNDFSASQSIEL